MKKNMPAGAVNITDLMRKSMAEELSIHRKFVLEINQWCTRRIKLINEFRDNMKGPLKP